ncbi:hypothetical protein FFM53_025610 (plasmid) [Rhizobium indicum]|uniref:Uncharacterized protein n=1 Tax=Rhizobium indicum TaxID=2583231 RepID=A0ABX6PMF0_9HYPH|nr:hypothetical protein FFM53_025610 [Rhizobium indicum]
MNVAVFIAHDSRSKIGTATGFAPIPRKPPTSMTAEPPAPAHRSGLLSKSSAWEDYSDGKRPLEQAIKLLGKVSKVA